MQRILKKIIGIIYGIFVAKKVLREHPGKTIVFSKNGIGDTCILLAYIDTFRKEHKIDRLAFLGDGRARQVICYFADSCDEFILMTDSKKKSALQRMYASDVGLIFRSRHPELIYAFPTAYVRHDLLLRNPYLNMSMLVKMTLGIPMNSIPCQIAQVSMEQANKIAELHQLAEHRTVIMNPYAGSMECVPENVFTELAGKLIKRGFCVITNVISGQKPVAGTIGVSLALSELVGMLNYCGYCVGLRSGFMDLARFSEAKLAVIDNLSYEYSNICRMENVWGKTGRLESFLYQESGGGAANAGG